MHPARRQAITSYIAKKLEQFKTRIQEYAEANLETMGMAGGVWTSGPRFEAARGGVREVGQVGVRGRGAPMDSNLAMRSSRP